MTQDEFIEKFGSVVVEFSHYYKYLFHYNGTGPASESITVAVGGDSDDIYRLEVCSGEKAAVGSLYPIEGSVTYADGTSEFFHDY